MDHPFFSIVIPVYNTEKELGRCVDSVIAQTFHDFEVILVDDGSTDSSGEICDRYAAQDHRIKTIHKQNGGCSAARNTGIRTAIGDYLLFVDSDDMWDDVNALKDIKRIIDDNAEIVIDTVCFGVSIYNEDGKLVKIRKPVTYNLILEDKYQAVKHLVYTNQYFSTSYVKALRREFFLENDLFFVKGLLSEDIEWSARVLINCEAIAVYPSAFYKRIQRTEGSITSAIGKKNILDILTSVEKGVDYVNENSEDLKLKSIYFEYWAYQYAMLLGLVAVMKQDSEYENVLQRLKNLSWLLKYDHVKKVRMVRICYAILGLQLTANILSKYYEIRRR